MHSAFSGEAYQRNGTPGIERFLVINRAGFGSGQRTVFHKTPSLRFPYAQPPVDV